MPSEDRADETSKADVREAIDLVSLAIPEQDSKKAKRTRKKAKGITAGLLTPDELVERFLLHSSGLVEDLHSLALRQVQAEEQRESRLDGKAQGLLVTSGLSLTVAFTFGGILLQHPEYLRPLAGLSSTVSNWPVRLVVVFYALALVGGLLSSILAVRALKVTNGYKTTDESDALNPSELLAADEEFSAEVDLAKPSDVSPEAASKSPDYKRANERAQARFRRYISVHYWRIWQQNTRVNDRKADIIGHGQNLFIVFLTTLLLIGTAIGYSACKRVESVANNSPLPVDASEGAKVTMNNNSSSGSTGSSSGSTTPRPTSIPMPSTTPSSTPRPAPTAIPGGGAPLKKSD